MLARAPDDFNAWVSLAQTERRAGRREAALAAFGRAFEANPGYAQGLAEMAVEERALGRPFTAERLLARALEGDAGNVVALLQMGDQARLANDLPAALGWFERAMAAAPSHVGAMLKASQTLADLGRFGDALAMLRAREAEHGPSPEELEEAHLLRRVGDWDAARLLLRRASAMAPRSFPIWAQLAQLERQSGNHDALAAMLREPPARTTPDQAAVQQLHGHLSEARWRFEEAIGHYELAARLNPNDSASHLFLARMRLLTLDLARCREHLAAQAALDRSKSLLQGRSGNPSQTHLGQLLDEFALDREALARIAAAQASAPAERVRPLLALVRDAPDYTPAAISLLIALRQAGTFAAGPPRQDGAASPIPKTVAQYWDAPDLPGELARLRATWREQNPDFACRLFDDVAAGVFLADNYDPGVLRAYRRAREPAKKADLFRLAYLFAEGGYYADVDDRCGAPIAAVVPPHARAAFFQEEYGTVGNNFVGAVPGHPIIGLALDLAVEAIARDDRDVLWLSTGPGLLTRAFAQTLARSSLNWGRWLDATVVLERGELARAVRVHCACAYKQTDRHWSRTAFGRAAKQSERARETAGEEV